MIKNNSYPSLRGKSFLVTGVTSGIGKHISYLLLQQGAKVFGIGRKNDNIKDFEKDYKDTFTFISFDLNNLEKIETIVNQEVIKTQKLDGLVHCAGKEETIPLSVYKTEKIQSLFKINVFAGIELLRIFSKKKVSNNNAGVVFFSSVMGNLGQPGKVGYCATKAALLGVVKASALELAKRKIRVNAISPGVVKTPMTEQLFNQLSMDNINEIEKMHPLGTGKTDDIASATLFLLSNESKWITGQNIIIDGGYSIQ